MYVCVPYFCRRSAKGSEYEDKTRQTMIDDRYGIANTKSARISHTVFISVSSCRYHRHSLPLPRSLKHRHEPSAPPHTLWCRFVGHFPFLFFVFLMPVVILFVFYFFVRFFSTFFSLSLRFCFVHAIRIMLIASCKSSSCLSGCGPGFFFHYEFAFPPCTNRSLKQKNQNYTTKL